MDKNRKVVLSDIRITKKRLSQKGSLFLISRGWFCTLWVDKKRYVVIQ